MRTFTTGRRCGRLGLLLRPSRKKRAAHTVPVVGKCQRPPHTLRKEASVIMASPDAPQTTSAPAPVRGNAEMTTFLADRTQDELREFQANKGDIYDAVQMRA